MKTAHFRDATAQQFYERAKIAMNNARILKRSGRNHFGRTEMSPSEWVGIARDHWHSARAFENAADFRARRREQERREQVALATLKSIANRAAMRLGHSFDEQPLWAHDDVLDFVSEACASARVPFRSEVDEQRHIEENYWLRNGNG